MSWVRIDIRHFFSSLVAACVLLVVAACASRQMEPARKIIAEIETAVVESGTEPARYTPDALKDVNEQVAVLKSRFEQEDYAGVLASAPATLAAARNLPAVAAARKAELHKLLEQEWANLSAEVPQQIEAVRIRIDGLAHQKTLPAGITAAMVDPARQGLDDSRALWERALAEQAAARPEEAVTLANQARDRVRGVATILDGAAAPASLK